MLPSETLKSYNIDCIVFHRQLCTLFITVRDVASLKTSRLESSVYSIFIRRSLPSRNRTPLSITTLHQSSMEMWFCLLRNRGFKLHKSSHPSLENVFSIYAHDIIILYTIPIPIGIGIILKVYYIYIYIMLIDALWLNYKSGNASCSIHPCQRFHDQKEPRTTITRFVRIVCFIIITFDGYKANGLFSKFVNYNSITTDMHYTFHWFSAIAHTRCPQCTTVEVGSCYRYYQYENKKTDLT